MDDIRDRRDELEQFVARTEGKVYPRRVFLGMAAAIGLAPVAARLTPALADAKELVLVNWGGDAVKGMQRSFVDPYLKKYPRSEEHTSELQSHSDLVCRLLLEKKNKNG